MIIDKQTVLYSTDNEKQIKWFYGIPDDFELYNGCEHGQFKFIKQPTYKEIFGNGKPKDRLKNNTKWYKGVK